MDQVYVPSTEGISIGEHTADLWLEIEGPSLEECIRRAINGLYSVMAQEFHLRSGTGIREILETDSKDVLIVDVLNEALFLFDSESSLILDPIVLSETEEKFSLTFRKVECEIPPGKGGMEVKAATFHGVELRETGGMWKGRVLLDL